MSLGGLKLRKSLYADDLVRYLSDPCTSIPKALEIRINCTNSLLFPINDQARQMSVEAYQLRRKKLVTLLPILVYQ